MIDFRVLTRGIRDGIKIEKIVMEIAEGFQNSQPSQDCLEAITDEVDLEMQKHLGKNDMVDYSIEPMDIREDKIFIRVLLQYGEHDEAGFYTACGTVTIG